jgi:PAS domain-containing protein
MSVASQLMFSTQIAEPVAPDAGLYTWDIERNLLFADPALARLFGLDAEDAMRGLPLERYLERVHPDDRPALAKVISDAIIAEIPQRSTYRVRGENGVYTLVASFGRAFRDRAETPILFSGIVVPVSDLNDVSAFAH